MPICSIEGCRAPAVCTADTTKPSRKHVRKRSNGDYVTVVFPTQVLQPHLCYYHRKHWLGLFTAHYPLHRNSSLRKQAREQQQVILQRNPALRRQIGRR